MPALLFVQLCPHCAEELLFPTLLLLSFYGRSLLNGTFFDLSSSDDVYCDSDSVNRESVFPLKDCIYYIVFKRDSVTSVFWTRVSDLQNRSERTIHRSFVRHLVLFLFHCVDLFMPYLSNAGPRCRPIHGHCSPHLLDGIPDDLPRLETYIIDILSVLILSRGSFLQPELFGTDWL